MTSEIMLLIGTLGGAFIGAITTISTTWIMKHYENKKMYHQLLMETGIKNWEGAKDWSINLLKDGQSSKLYPLELFIVHHSKIIQLIMDNNLTPETLKKVRHDMEEFNKVYEKQRV